MGFGHNGSGRYDAVRPYNLDESRRGRLSFANSGDRFIAPNPWDSTSIVTDGSWVTGQWLAGCLDILALSVDAVTLFRIGRVVKGKA